MTMTTYQKFSSTCFDTVYSFPGHDPERVERHPGHSGPLRVVPAQVRLPRQEHGLHHQQVRRRHGHLQHDLQVCKYLRRLIKTGSFICIKRFH